MEISVQFITRGNQIDSLQQVIEDKMRGFNKFDGTSALWRNDGSSVRDNLNELEEAILACDANNRKWCNMEAPTWLPYDRSS